jgi:hypothetical protein
LTHSQDIFIVDSSYCEVPSNTRKDYYSNFKSDCQFTCDISKTSKKAAKWSETIIKILILFKCQVQTSSQTQPQPNGSGCKYTNVATEVIVGIAVVASILIVGELIWDRILSTS